MNLLEHFVGSEADFGPAGETSGFPAEVRGRCDVEVLDLASGSVLKRMARLLVLRRRVARSRGKLRASGATEIGSFGFYPDLNAPTIVYDLAGPARPYVENHMLPGKGLIRAFVLRAAAAWAGCDPRVGAVVVVGARR